MMDMLTPSCSEGRYNEAQTWELSNEPGTDLVSATMTEVPLRIPQCRSISTLELEGTNGFDPCQGLVED